MPKISPAAPDFLPPFTGWVAPGPRRRYCDRRGYHDPEWCLARVSAGADWDRLDDAIRRIVGKDRGPYDFVTRYAFVPKRYVQQLVEEFTRLDAANRLQLRLLPDPPAGQPTLDGRTTT